MAIAIPKSHSQQSHQSVPLSGLQEGGDEDHDEEVKPFENDSSQSSLPRPLHPHVVLPVETKPSSHEKERQERQIVWEEDEEEEDLGFAKGDEEEDEDGRQIEWEEDEEVDQLESVFAEDEKSRWGGMSGSSSSGSSSLQDSQVSAHDWLQLVAAAVGEFWTEGQEEEELSVEWSESSEEESDSVAE
jgi:hypothetical protein